MVDPMQVLEGATYLAFIIGALVAVYEVRSISRDRKVELSMRLGEHWVSREFAEVMAKWDQIDFTSAETAEKTCSKVDLIMMAEFFNYAASLARDKYVSEDFVLGQFDFEYVWNKMKPWSLDWRRRAAPDELSDFEWIAGEQQRRRLAAERTGEDV